jgi:cobalamin biosynthesis protein CobD/CbiB
VKTLFEQELRILKGITALALCILSIFAIKVTFDLMDIVPFLGDLLIAMVIVYILLAIFFGATGILEFMKVFKKTK